MSQREFIEARLNFTRTELDQVLAHLSDDLVTWAPRDGMKTVGNLLLEIANKDREIVRYLQTGQWPDDEPDPFSETSSLAEMKRGLQSTRDLTFQYLSQFDDDGLNEIIHLPEGWWEALRLLECPRGEMLRNISAHEWYHTGQLITYLWSRGDNPEEWD
jgi:uncharacterized damage-inducible protein DinB